MDKQKLDIFTVVICTYNRADLLKNTLESLANQVVPDHIRWSVLVVDNNCSDHTPDVIQSYQSRIGSLSTVCETKQGLTEARQCGVKTAKTEWLGFVDDDCTVETDWIEQAVKFIASKPNAAGFVGKNTIKFESPPPSYVHATMLAGFDLGTENPSIVPHSLPGAGLILNRKSVIASGWLEQPVCGDRRGTSLLSGGDNELSLRARSQGGELWFVPNCRLTHVVSNDRLKLWYLIRLNYSLSEPLPILALITNEADLKSWRYKSLKSSIVYFTRATGMSRLFRLKRDPLSNNSYGFSSRLLSAARACGYTVGFIKAMRRSHAEPNLNGLAIYRNASND